LSKEKGQKINTYENSMLDSFLSVPYKKPTLAKRKYFILIVHRQEHVIFRKERSINLIKTIFENMDKNMTCVFICHATTRNFLESANMAIPNEIKKRVKFVPRLSYVDFVNLLRRSEFLITDGGSNQEEAYYLGLPCLLLRKYTERIEGLGKNVVLSKEKESVISDFMKNYKKNKSPKIKPKRSPSKIIVDYLSKA
jgi:UDP-N-acetylglucosamine 2-epimerase (non-hydrolysing)